MYLHQLVFDDFEAARTALAAHGNEEDSQWHWSGHVVAPQRAVLARAVYANDEDGSELSPEQLAPGYWLQVIRSEPDEALIAMPGCTFVSAATGHVAFVREGVDIASPIIEPWPAGFAPPILS